MAELLIVLACLLPISVVVLFYADRRYRQVHRSLRDHLRTFQTAKWEDYDRIETYRVKWDEYQAQADREVEARRQQLQGKWDERRYKLTDLTDEEVN